MEQVPPPAAEPAAEAAAEQAAEPAVEPSTQASVDAAVEPHTEAAPEATSEPTNVLGEPLTPQGSSDAPEDAQIKAILEAIIYITDEPLSGQQMAAALAQPLDKIKRLLDELVEDYAQPSRGLSIREVAGGYKMATKAEHHEAVRAFVKKLTPPLKLSLAALETLAVIAYKQPVTAPEIMDIRGVQGAGVLKTLLDRKLIAEGGRKAVVGKPILYKTTKEFLVQFGLKDVHELPTLKEFEELGRLELVEETPAPPEAAAAEATPAESVAAEIQGEVDAAAEAEPASDTESATAPPPQDA